VEDQGQGEAGREIVDDHNVFRNMRGALKDYAQGQEMMPVQEKDDFSNSLTTLWPRARILRQHRR
jgi:hypothetical protein